MKTTNFFERITRFFESERTKSKRVNYQPWLFCIFSCCVFYDLYSLVSYICNCLHFLAMIAFCIFSCNCSFCNFLAGTVFWHIFWLVVVFMPIFFCKEEVWTPQENCHLVLYGGGECPQRENYTEHKIIFLLLISRIHRLSPLVNSTHIYIYFKSTTYFIL